MSGRRNAERELNWKLSIDRFLTKKETKKLRQWAKNNRQSWLESALIEIALNTGLRVAEIADLRCGNITLREELSCVFVNQGKCGKQRTVTINKEFQEFLRNLLIHKKEIGEKTGYDDFLLFSKKSKGKYSTRGLQHAFKRCLRKAGIDMRHSIHHLRHTYASCLLSSSKNNVRLVQKQLGHSSIAVTQVYLDVFSEELHNAVEKLWH
jgi:integrase/recombinase XerD